MSLSISASQQNNFIQPVVESIKLRDASLFDQLSIENKIDVFEVWKKAIEALEPESSHQDFAKRVLGSVQSIIQLNIGKIPDSQLFKICMVAQKALEEKEPKQEAIHFKKQQASLPHSLLIDFKNKTFTVLLKKQGPIIVNGAMAKVSSGIEVKSEADVVAKHVAQKVNTDTQRISDLELKYEGLYGALCTVVEYKKGKISKRSFTKEAYECDLFEAVERQRFTMSEKLQILYDIALQLEKMHRDGVVHNDIKMDNVLFRRKNGKAEVLLFDFGHTFSPREQEKPLTEAYYGTPPYTACELFEKFSERSLQSTEEMRKPLDMYAFGLLAYNLKNDGEEPSYISAIVEDLVRLRQKIQAQRRDGRGVDSTVFNDYKTKIQQFKKHLEEGRKIIASLDKKSEQGELLTDEEKLDRIICRLLDVDPEKRMTVTELCHDLAQVINSR